MDPTSVAGLQGSVHLTKYNWLNSESLKIVPTARSGRPGGRRFLVFLVPQRDVKSPLLALGEENRNFDVAVRFYEDPGLNDKFLETADYVMTGGLSKFHAASEFFKTAGIEQDYEGYLFLDGDLEFDAARLSCFLDFSLAAGLDLAQPSLTRDSYSYWKMAYHQPRYIYRETSFVEVMAPYLSRAALSRVLPTFSQSISSYGLDLVWASLIESDRIGVVDAFQVRHRERVDHDAGRFYMYLRSIGVDLDEEEQRILANYGVTPEKAHSKRGYVLKEQPPYSGDNVSLVSVPLYAIEKKSDRQWVIDLCMRLASLGPARREVAKSISLQEHIRGLLNWS